MTTLANRAGMLETENAFTVLQRAAELTASGRDVINLGIGQPDFPTPDHIVEAGIKALRDGHHGYTPSGGIAPLKDAVAADIDRRYGFDINPGNVQILPGGKLVIFFAAMLTGEEGGEILFPDPGFPIYRSAIRFSGATPAPYPLSEENGFAFSAEDVLSRITPRTRLLILNSPANPTGGVTPRNEIEALVKGLEDHPHVMVMSDEIYDQLIFDGNAMTSLLEFPSLRDRLIVLNGWSKTYAMTGWRLGYAIWPDMMLDAADKLAVNIHSCVNASAQFAALAALTGPQDCIAQMKAAFQHRVGLITDGLNALPGFSCGRPGGAFYAFPNITGTGMKSAELQASILEDIGVAIIGGTSFGEEGEGYLRFSCANSDDAITEALGRIRNWLEQR